LSWRRLGRVFGPEGHPGVNARVLGTPTDTGVLNRTQVPTALIMADRIRLYFSSRASSGHSFPLFVDVSRVDPTQVLCVSEAPVMAPGAMGAFDEDGVMPSAVLRHDGRLLLYYTGWNAKVSTPYHNAIGLAESVDGGVSFERCFAGPVMDRTPEEPYLAVTPTVIIEDGVWRCWYTSGIRWTAVGGRREPVYGVKAATSTDGVHWDRYPALCLPPVLDGECQANPSVLRIGGEYRMWFAFRGISDYRGEGQGSYRIGFARSTDGVHWARDDQAAGLDVGSASWEDQMVCYPFVVEDNGRMLMFYNGNSFGQGGIGVAQWVDRTLDPQEETNQDSVR
jgi:hypothetical protein